MSAICLSAALLIASCRPNNPAANLGSSGPGGMFTSSAHRFVAQLRDAQAPVFAEVVSSVPMREVLIGRSVRGVPIVATQIGRGATNVVLLGSIHGDWERNTGVLVEEFLRIVERRRSIVPEDVSLTIVPWVNPDGVDDRRNAREVDLNRNWATSNWTADPVGMYSVLTGDGGTRPFSEPESRAIRDLLTELSAEHGAASLYVLSFHSIRFPQRYNGEGLVVPGYDDASAVDPRSWDLAQRYAELCGYRAIERWIGPYEVTGEAVNWMANHGIAAVDVELPNDLPPGVVFVDADGSEVSHLAVHTAALIEFLASLVGTPDEGDR